VTLLLDTLVTIWWLVVSRRLGAPARKLLAESACVLSAASVWEVAIKHRLGKLPVGPVLFRDRMIASGAEMLAISDTHAIETAALPRHHDDGKSIDPWPHGAARFAHSPAPRPRRDGAQWGFCRLASRYSRSWALPDPTSSTPAEMRRRPSVLSVTVCLVRLAHELSRVARGRALVLTNARLPAAGALDPIERRKE
jgi:PIN domain nuclease of toxin-antitoxin system